MKNNYKFYIYIYKFIYLLLYMKYKNIKLNNSLIFIVFIKILINFIYKKINYISLNNYIKKKILNLYLYKNYIIKYYILTIKLNSKITKNLKILSYKCYILSNLINYFGLGKSKSIFILNSIRKSKYNSLILLFNINIFKENLKNTYYIKYKKTKIMIIYNDKYYKSYKNYFNSILILLNIYKYNIKIYNNNINNIYKIIYKSFKKCNE